MATNPFEEIALKLDSIERAIQNFSNSEKENEPQWMTLEQLVQYLPGNPAKSTIYAKVSKGEIPFTKYAKRLVFDKAEIDNWIKSKK